MLVICRACLLVDWEHINVGYSGHIAFVDFTWIGPSHTLSPVLLLWYQESWDTQNSKSRLFEFVVPVTESSLDVR